MFYTKKLSLATKESLDFGPVNWLIYLVSMELGSIFIIHACQPNLEMAKDGFRGKDLSTL